MMLASSPWVLLVGDRLAQAIFEVEYLVVERRLIDPSSCGCATKMLFLGDKQKIAEMPKLNAYCSSLG
jgi:hypothetical protein